MRDPDARGLPAQPSPWPEAGVRSRIRRMVEGELLPRLMLTHHAGPLPPSFVARAERAAVHPRFDDFLHLVRTEPEEATVRGFLEEIVDDGGSVEMVLAELLAPTARRMGVLWENDECDFVEVTLVCSRLQRAIRRLATRFRQEMPKDGVSVLVSSLPHAQHTLGALMVAETLARAGCDIALGEPFVPGMDPFGFDFVALSVSRSEEEAAATAFVRELRAKAPNTHVIVGGAAFRADPAMITRVGADGWAEDADSARSLVKELMGTTLSSACGQA